MDERFDEENPMEYSEKLEKLWEETKQNLKEENDGLNQEQSNTSSEELMPEREPKTETNTEEDKDSSIPAAAAIGGLLAGAKKITEDVVTGSKELAEDAIDAVKDGTQSIADKAIEATNNTRKTINEAAGSLVDNDIPAVLRPKDIFAKDDEITHENLEDDKQKIADILNELKEKNFNKDYGLLSYLLSFPIILLAIWQFIQFGFTIRLVVVVLLAIFFLIYRGAMKGITKEVFDLKAKIQVEQLSPVKDLMAKVNYVLSGIELNLKRISYTKWLYVVFTPFLLYAVAETWKGPFDAKTTFYMFVVGFVFSLIVWPIVFKKDTKNLEDLEFDLNSIRREFI